MSKDNTVLSKSRKIPNFSPISASPSSRKALIAVRMFPISLRTLNWLLLSTHT